MHPDIIIVLEDGRVKSVVSNHHLTYAVIDRSFSKLTPPGVPDPKESDFVGTHKQMLRHVGLPVPVTKEFDPTAVINVAAENKFLSGAMTKFGFPIGPTAKALAPNPDQLQPAFVKALRALYNGFIVTDPKLMETYLNIQQR